MKKIKFLFLVAFMAIGFTASAQIFVNNTTGLSFGAVSSSCGTGTIPPGFSIFNGSCTPGAFDNIALGFFDASCGINRGFTVIFNGAQYNYLGCAPAPLTFNGRWDAATHTLLLFP